jgi:hypothetical protein
VTVATLLDITFINKENGPLEDQSCLISIRIGKVIKLSFYSEKLRAKPRVWNGSPIWVFIHAA